ncbi:calcium-binding protein [Ruegeria marina]|uniref:Ca2+-binding protein, RTX toxin-related n=1 Tax=Ruegeria marina TaxID=639004 RepID=A0A1G6WRR2_9RHOB|nr:calcium-binding protein [Ruegeria marina]SDD68353.1 Ca2+-binding protein, RTX toxin-related [Ruegeria marina]
MTSTQEYLQATSQVSEDLSDLGSFLLVLDAGLQTADRVLALPGNLETLLRDRADLIDLPNAVVRLLGSIPYGIGTAIRQLDRVANSVSGTIDAQADILAALDLSWQPAQNLVTVLSEAGSTASVTLAGFEIATGVRVDEAQALSASFGSEQVPSGTELDTRLSDYVEGAERWFQQRDALVEPMRSALNQVTVAVDDIETLLPNLADVRADLDRALSVFRGAANTANRILDALDVDVNLPWPFPDTNLLDVIEAISGVFSAISGFVEDLVFSILRSLGIDIDRVFDPVQDAMLSALQPLFGALATLQSATQQLIGVVSDGLETIRQNLENVLATLADEVDFGALFANTEFGDEAPGLVDFADVLDGGDGEDGLYGLQGNDILRGFGGGDFLFGGIGRDTLSGGEGSDELYGGAGNDALFGGAGADQIHGQSGNDTLWGGLGNDTLVGQEGTDRAAFSIHSGMATIQRNGQTVVVTSSEGVDFLQGVEFLQFSNGVIEVATLAQSGSLPTAGNDRLSGGPQGDFLDGLSGNDTVLGRGGADTLFGSGGNDLLAGHDGDDEIEDLSGDNTVFAGAGNDSVQTGAGQDEIWGGPGSDSLFAGGGADTVGGSDGNDAIGLGSGDDQGWGGAGNDTIFAAAGNDTIAGADGSDDLWAGDGADLVFSGAGNDRAAGAGGDDTVWGGAGNNVIFGADGQDELRGGAGDDTLYGGAGDDSLTGGLDRDVFVFGNGADLVLDFQATPTGDIVDLRFASGIEGFADLQANHMTEAGGGTMITDGMNSMTLAGVSMAQLTSDHFLF